MNRSQRRAAARSGRQGPPEPREPRKADPERKPGFVLRVFANIVLAPWVLTRVNHPHVERLLADVAAQAGRPEIEKNLLNRIAMRKEKRG